MGAGCSGSIDVKKSCSACSALVLESVLVAVAEVVAAPDPDAAFEDSAAPFDVLAAY